MGWWFTVLLGALLYLPIAEGSVVLTQTHPAAPYVCRTGNITLRCQYGGVETVLVVLWLIGNETTTDPSNISGHTALPRTTTYQEVVVDSYTNLAGYRCAPTLSNGTQLLSNPYKPQYESAEVTLSNLTLASRTATTLSVTWSASYPKCYSFTVSHSTQDGSLNVSQPADSDISHTLTSLQPGATYRIEVEAVRKGDGADRQRAKVARSFTTESAMTPAPVSSKTVIPTATSTSLTLRPSALAETAVANPCPQLAVTVTVLSVLLSLVSMLSLSTCTLSAVVVAVMYKRLQRCRAELRGGGGDSVKAGPEGEGPPTSLREEEEEGEKMQTNPAYLPIEMSYKSQESKYINVPS